MNKFKLQIIGTLSLIIIAIVATLISLSYNAFKGESVDLNRALLREKNVTIKAGLVEKFNGYRQMLSSINISTAEITTGGLSLNAIAQLKSLSRTQSTISDGVFLFT